jgi:hypothetical protein
MPSTVDPVVDDSMVEAEICKAWLRSEVGLDAKKNNWWLYERRISS